MTSANRTAATSRSESSVPTTTGSIFKGAEWLPLCTALNLSRREGQVVHLVLQDCTELDIGDRLGISPHTVHTHLLRVYRKLGVNSRLSLAVAVFNAYRDNEIKCAAVTIDGPCPLHE